MDYEQKYKAALEWMQGMYGGLHGKTKEEAEKYFPELAESEDERIRKSLIEYFGEQCDMSDWNGVYGYQVLDWLKKQGNPADKVEPKFHESEWITHNTANFVFKIINVSSIGYDVVNRENYKKTISFDNEDNYHLWTIEDAKDGDILVNGSNIFIFSHLSDTRAMGYCHINLDDGRFYDDKDKTECFGLIDAVFSPATKEQRDFLFAKMKEAGYEWDAEKKELRKIELKFHEGDWVVISTSDGRKVVQVVSIEYFPSGQPMYITSEGRWFGSGTYSASSGAIFYTEAHLWNISQDAKDGDVICYKDEISLYKCEISLYRKDIKPETSFGGFMYHYCYDGKRFIMNNFYSLTEQDKTDIHPATEEQRGLLFAKMKEAGYEWDDEKKELRKIAQSELTEFEDAVKDMMNAYRDAIGANDVTTEEIKKHAKYLLSLIPHKPIEQKLSNSENIGKNEKPMWTDEDEKRLQSCIIELQGKGLMGGVDTIDTKWLKSLKQRIHVSSAKTCKNDTLLDLLQKMPSCITVDGIDYHFVLKKTIAYMAFYEGEGEGSDKVIFWMAGDPVDLLTEMLEKLKEKGLLE